ncbi:MAG: multidrug effflux MFS transporter [Pseudomonadota bacterium]
MGKRLPLPEFVALTALLFSLIAYGTDAMLPAMEAIAEGVNAPSVTRVQLVIGIFILGTGLGQLLAGPLSDAIGRKPVLIGGILLFMAASLWAAVVESLEWLLVARMIQGLGVSAPRTVGMAMVRDLYEGRVMASVISLAMTVFMIVPALAPLIGQGLMLSFGWRSIFLSFLVFGAVSAGWLWLRQGETHAVVNRRPLRLATYVSGLSEVMTNRRTVTCIAVLALVYAFIFSYLTSAQQVFVDWLGTGTRFPFYFAVIAVISAAASALNAYLVLHLGMWRLSTVGIAAVAITSLTAGTVTFTGAAEGHELLLFMAWSVSLFFLASLIFANLNALAMEPMGHIAGVASALIGAVATIGSVAIATPIGQAYDGTGVPLMFGIGICASLAFVIALTIPRNAQ